MPITLTENPAIFPAVPAPVNSDGITTTDIRAALQALTNRTAALKGGGVVTLIRNGTVAQMRALVYGTEGVAGGHMFLVPGFGLYVFNEDVVDDNPPWLQRADDAGGTWVLLPYGALDQPLGFPSLDGVGRVDAAKVRNGIIASVGSLFGTRGASFATTASGAYGDIGAASIAVPSVVTGDVLLINASVPIRASATAGGSVELYVDDGTTQTELQQIDYVTNANLVVTLRSRYVATHTHSHTVKPRFNSAGGGTATVLGQVSLDVLQIRP